MLCMLLGVGNMWAAEEVYKTALFGESYNSKAVSSYDNSWSATNEDFTVDLTNFNNNNNGWNYVKCGRKNNASTGTITTASAIDKAVTKVVVTVDAFTSGKVNSFKLYVASNAEFSTDIQTISHSIATGANTFTVTAPTENQFYKIEIDCESGSSNGLVQISKIEYFYDNSPVGDDRDPAGLSYSTDVFSATIGETNTFPTLNNPNSLTVTYASSDESIATINSNGAITLLAAGETVISASFAGNDSYKEGSASYTLTVIDPNAPGMSAENPYTITQAKAAIDAGTGVTGVYVEGVISQIDSYNTTYHSITYWISTDGSTADFEVYSGRGLNNADFAAVTDLKVGDQVVIYGNIKKYNSTYEFDKENYIVSLVREEKQEPELAFNPTSVEINVGDTFTAPTLSNPHNVAVTYESTNTAIATVSADGTVTLAGGTGTTTITASFAGDDSFFAGEAFYTLTVVDPNAPGTEDNPYTVAQVLELYANNNVPATEVYVKGTISRITSLNPPTYKNARYYISDDGTEIDEFYVYNGKYLDGADFTSTDQIKVGDEVVIYGKLTSYSGTDEFAAGNYITSLTRPESTDPVISAEDVTLAYDATSGEIAYTISNVDEGTTLDGATTDADWVNSIAVSADKVTFTVTANEGTADRIATFILSYGDVEKEVTVTQGHYVAPVIDYATLPFAFDGGKADIANTVGLSQDGLDSDYGTSPKLKFNSTDDVVILHFNEQPGTLSFDIKGNSFSGGSFTVQTSVDGVTYTNLKSYTSLASTVQSEIFEDLEADVRYIKWVFTEKSSGNVALGNITLAKYTVKQDATVSFKKDGEAITTLEANLNAEIEVAVECSVEGAELSITSSNSRVAKYEDGVVKALSEGEATITATFAGNDEYKSATATLAVTVVDNRQYVTLAFNDVPAEININETATYAVTATPAVEGITYSSSAPAIVSVDETTGAIEALAVGTATITANFAGNDSYKAATATYTIKVVNPDFAASKYELVADATTLKAGDEIVFVNIGSAKVSGVVTNFAQAMAAKGNNLFNATDITVNDDNTILTNAETSIFTLEGTDGAWSFKLGSEYLAATGMGTQNYLGTSTIVEDASTATIVINEGEASVTFASSNRNVLSHNFNSGNARFSCYSAKQNGLQIYRKVTSSEEPLKGDVNNDKQVSIADVTALVNIILGKATPETNPEYNFEAANVNEDDTVSIADVTALVNIILGKE